MDYQKILMLTINDIHKGVPAMESLIEHLGTADMVEIDKFINWAMSKGYFILVQELRNNEG